MTPERDWQRSVVELAEILGWLSNHTRRSISGRKGGWVTSTTLKGVPDLMLIRPPRLVFAELKSEKGRLTPEQSRVIDLLGRCAGVEVYVWRPDQLDEVAHILRRTAVMAP